MVTLPHLLSQNWNCHMINIKWAKVEWILFSVLFWHCGMTSMYAFLCMMAWYGNAVFRLQFVVSLSDQSFSWARYPWSMHCFIYPCTQLGTHHSQALGTPCKWSVYVPGFFLFHITIIFNLWHSDTCKQATNFEFYFLQFSHIDGSNSCHGSDAFVCDMFSRAYKNINITNYKFYKTEKVDLASLTL